VSEYAGRVAAWLEAARKAPRPADSERSDLDLAKLPEEELRGISVGLDGIRDAAAKIVGLLDDLVLQEPSPDTLQETLARLWTQMERANSCWRDLTGGLADRGMYSSTWD
jgi:hypothetical protein